MNPGIVRIIRVAGRWSSTIRVARLCSQKCDLSPIGAPHRIGLYETEIIGTRQSPVSLRAHILDGQKSTRGIKGLHELTIWVISHIQSFVYACGQKPALPRDLRTQTVRSQVGAHLPRDRVPTERVLWTHIDWAIERHDRVRPLSPTGPSTSRTGRCPCIEAEWQLTQVGRSRMTMCELRLSIRRTRHRMSGNAVGAIG